MINYNMKPCVPDGKDTLKIAKRILKRSFKKENKLESLLKISFTATVKSIDIDNINDFPKMTLRKLKKRITLSSFKIRLCKSYFSQIRENGQAYFLSNQMIEKYLLNRKVRLELKTSKLLAVLIPSRHKRSLKTEKKTGRKTKKQASSESNPKNFNTYYNVFIQYAPIIDTSRKQKSHAMIKSKKNNNEN